MRCFITLQLTTFVNIQCLGPERCTCDAVYEYCYDMDLFREMFDECPRCRDPQSDCTLIGDTCNSGACFSCGNHALVTSQNVCNSAGQQNPPLSSSQTNPGTSVGLVNVKCVETEWLKRNGFSQGILREFGVAKTLCINGLPCGTEGHLLRDCNVDGICKLVTYRDVCSRRGNCTVKYAEVSLISHKIDWSTVEEKECREQGRTLRLTSLSEDVEGRFIPISRFVASIGENAVEKGYGGVIDLVVLAILDIIEVLNFIRSEIPKMLTK